MRRQPTHSRWCHGNEVCTCPRPYRVECARLGLLCTLCGPLIVYNIFIISIPLSHVELYTRLFSRFPHKGVAQVM